MHESSRNGTSVSATLRPSTHAMAGPLHGQGNSFYRPLLVGIRIRRIRRLGELVLQLRADRRVEVQSLRRDLLGEPFVIDRMSTRLNSSHVRTSYAVFCLKKKRYTGNRELRRFCRNRYRTVLVPSQIAEDGRFPCQLRPTKPYGYSLFHLAVLPMVCHILS